MSDARPITNITDYVCSTCWTSFSRQDPGALQGDRVVCPKCGTPLPSDNVDLAAAVRSHRSGSDGFSADTGFDQTLTEQPQISALGDRPGNGFVPPDLLAPSAPGGFVVGDVEDDFDFEEKTLRPDQNLGALLNAVQAGTESELLSNPLATQTSPNKGVAADSASAALADGDWKLKSMGLVYNFHGIDALMAWAGNKAGQSLSVSVDGSTWKDFGSFYESYRNGTPIAAALSGAAEPGGPGALPVPQVTYGSSKPSGQMAKPSLPELGTDPNKKVPASVFDIPGVKPGQDVGKLAGGSRPTAPLGGASNASSPNRPVSGGSPSQPGVRPMPGRQPAAAPTVERENNPNTFYVLLGLLVLLALLAGVHLSGVYKLPFLP